MPRTRRLAAALLLLSLLATSFVAGCSPKGPTFVDGNVSYSLASTSATAAPEPGTKPITDAYAMAELAKLTDAPVSDAEQLRHDALVGLRSRGGEAAKAADLITKSFPSDTRGVPVYVERALVGGRRVFVIIEAAGPPSGNLSAKRLWVMSENGDVLYAGSR